MVPQPPDPRARDQLAIVQLYPLEVVTRDEMVERLIGYQGEVVQLQDGQVLRGTGCGPQVTDALVRDELAVAEAEEL